MHKAKTVLSIIGPFFLLMLSGACQKRLPLKKTFFEGVVLDFDTGLPVKNAYVFICRHHSGGFNPGYVIARTDENGNFKSTYRIEISKSLKEDYARGFINFSVSATAYGYSQLKTTSDRELADSGQIFFISPGQKNTGIVLKIKKLRKITFRLIDEPPYDNFDKVNFSCEKRFSSQRSYNLGFFGNFSSQLFGLENDTTFVLIDNSYRFNISYEKNGVSFTKYQILEFGAHSDGVLEVKY
jgi:hypothetical protein